MRLSVQINGRICRADVDGDTPLLWVLRDVFGLTGTKFGCGQARCGACTDHVDGVPAHSCVTPIESVGESGGMTIETLHTIAHEKPLQDAWIEFEVPQCGYVCRSVAKCDAETER
ncbi:aerobic-type carbon monoxide dehydrogenase small subunit (CoxS/CutS family) [Rhizobium tibeticum]|nr:aerobic-type carbon monoxide dehydrogenase small subunit (CoxS/CutS family) [Rhizobium tibeticum]